jgi:ribose transport system substrate-binding protein
MRKIVCLVSLILVLVMITGLIDRANSQAVGPVQVLAALHGKGRIRLVYHAANFFVTRQRYEAFKKTITENYPEITIVAEQGIREPSFFKDADRAASVMLAANPNLSGIWAVWDLPPEGVISAVRARDDLVITTIDLGLNVAAEMARNKPIRGVGAQRPYDQGVTGALQSIGTPWIRWTSLPPRLSA